MIPTILFCTNFSDASREALDFAAQMANEYHNRQVFRLILLHLYDLPTNYSGEGLALTSWNEEFSEADQRLNEELEWIREKYPDLKVEKKLASGNLTRGIREQVIEERASMVIIGAGGHYSDLLSWDKDLVDLVRSFPIPVLVIPRHHVNPPLKNIALACNLEKPCLRLPFEQIRNIMQLTEARLHVLFVAPANEELSSICKDQERLVLEQLSSLQPELHTLRSPRAVEAIGQFVKDHQIDLLLVTPRRHGVWETLMKKDTTRQLVLLDALPILALRQALV